MDSLRSTALIPGEPEFRSEFNLLNSLLYKVPKGVDLRPILGVKPLQPRHCVALQELHSQLFPIRYDPKFFEVACSTECGFFDTQSFWDFFDTSQNDTRDLDWYENQILSIGLFLPRSYLSFFRRTGSFNIDEYLKFLEGDGGYSDFDDPLTETLLYDAEDDEFMVGFVTALINMEVTNNLISDDDYGILSSFFKLKVAPLLTPGTTTDSNRAGVGATTSSSGPNDPSTTNSSSTSIEGSRKVNGLVPPTDNDHDSDDLKEPLEERGGEGDEERIKKCLTLNTDLLDDVLYSFLYNQLYTNELLAEYLNKFNIRGAKTIYILSTGVTLGLRRRGLGSSLMLFIQLLIYHVKYQAYIYHSLLYKPLSTTTNYKARGTTDSANRSSEFELRRRMLYLIRNQYNSKVVQKELLHTYYTLVLNVNYQPAEKVDLTKLIEVSADKIVLPFSTTTTTSSSGPNDPKTTTNTTNSSATNNEGSREDGTYQSLAQLVEGSSHQPLKSVDSGGMPLAVYLHTIYYNESATKMYENLHFYRIANIPDYYNINGKRYDANFLAHYIGS